jgi:hypothetical protein
MVLQIGVNRTIPRPPSLNVILRSVAKPSLQWSLRGLVVSNIVLVEAFHSIPRTRFVQELTKIRPLDLRLKTGLVRTSQGPLCFLLFFVPNPVRPGSVHLAIDAHINPLDVQHLAVWRDLARQSHWHLVLVGPNDKLVDLFEFENTFGLDQTLDQIEIACSSMAERGTSFEDAKVEFAATYSIENLLQI